MRLSISHIGRLPGSLVRSPTNETPMYILLPKAKQEYANEVQNATNQKRVVRLGSEWVETSPGKEFPTRSVTPSSLSASVNGVIRKHGATPSTRENAPQTAHAWIETRPGCLDILLAFVSIVAALVSAWSCPTALSSSDCPRGLWGVISLFVSAATQMTVCDLLSSRSF